jgi:hypothetical protein
MSEKTIIKLVTPKGRVSFPTLFTPKATGKNGSGTPQWSVQILLKKGDAEAEKFIKELQAAMKLAVTTKWPDEAKRPRKLASALKDGDTWEGEDGFLKKEKYAEVAGHWVINANNKKRKPKVVDADVSEILDPEEVYSGCWGRASFQVYAYENEKNGVGFSLQNFQKQDDGERFGGGGSDPKDDFGLPVAGGADAASDPMFA